MRRSVSGERTDSWWAINLLSVRQNGCGTWFNLPFYKEVVELMSPRKWVTPLIWWISSADSEQIEWGTGGVVNNPNQSKLSNNHFYTRGQIYETSMESGRPFVEECSILKKEIILNFFWSTLFLATVVIENRDVFWLKAKRFWLSQII